MSINHHVKNDSLLIIVAPAVVVSQAAARGVQALEAGRAEPAAAV